MKKPGGLSNPVPPLPPAPAVLVVAPPAPAVPVGAPAVPVGAPAAPPPAGAPALVGAPALEAAPPVPRLAPAVEFAVPAEGAPAVAAPAPPPPEPGRPELGASELELHAESQASAAPVEVQMTTIRNRRRLNMSSDALAHHGPIYEKNQPALLSQDALRTHFSGCPMTRRPAQSVARCGFEVVIDNGFARARR